MAAQGKRTPAKVSLDDTIPLKCTIENIKKKDHVVSRDEPILSCPCNSPRAELTGGSIYTPPHLYAYYRAFMQEYIMKVQRGARPEDCWQVNVLKIKISAVDLSNWKVPNGLRVHVVFIVLQHGKSAQMRIIKRTIICNQNNTLLIIKSYLRILCVFLLTCTCPPGSPELPLRMSTTFAAKISQSHIIICFMLVGPPL